MRITSFLKKEEPPDSNQTGLTNKHIYAYWAVCIGILALYLSPYFIWGQDCLINISDNLDSNMPCYKVLAENAHHFGWNNPTAFQFMNGLPKAAFLSQWNVIFLLFYLFPPFIAYAFNLMLIHFTAFFGMLWLLRRLSPETRTNAASLIIYGTALCFALLDFFPAAGLSIAGQPLLLIAFMNIRKGIQLTLSFLIIALFPLYSSLVFAGVFILFILFIWGIYTVLTTQKNRLFIVLGILLLLVSYMLVESELLVNTIAGTNFVSHRTEMDIPHNSFLVSCIAVIKIMIYGPVSHVRIHQFPVLLLSLLGAYVILFFRKSAHSKTLHFLLLLAFLLALISGFYPWSAFASLKEHTQIIRTFDFTRFYFLLPLVFYLLFFYSLKVFTNSLKYAGILISVLMIYQLGLEFKRNLNDKTLYTFLHSSYSNRHGTNHSLTYRQYYSEKLFKDVQQYIGAAPSTFRTLCLGIDPGVLHYNGFYTLDAYLSNYSLVYKVEFRKIIEKELEMNASIRKTFDGFGSYCYMFSAELGNARIFTKYDTLQVHSLQLNIPQIKHMGGKYIIAAVPVTNSEKFGLLLRKKFEHPESMYTIYLYQVL